MSKLNVLYICGAGTFCGSTRSLYESLKVLRNEKVNPYFISVSGSVNPFYNSVSKGVIETRGLSKFDNTRYSYYRGVRYLILLREIFYIPFTLIAFIKAKLQFKEIDLIHINEITNIPSLILARLFFNVPIVIHVRALFRNTESLRSKLIIKLLKKYTDAIIAIDENVKESMEIDDIITIHNSFELDSTEKDLSLVDKLKYYDNSFFKVGFIGNFLKNKGLNDLLDSAILLKDITDIKFLILGDEIRKSKNLLNTILTKLGIIENPKKELLNKIITNGIEDKFILLGKSYDLNSYFQAIDILCFPSHLDAPGRPIFEAAFHEVPSIACIKKPKNDTFQDNVTGLIVPEKNPKKLAEAIYKLYKDPLLVKKMGSNVAKLAELNFSPIPNAEKIYTLYTQVLKEKIINGQNNAL